jgi:ABC-type transporter Mla subunit MlaD
MAAAEHPEWLLDSAAGLTERSFLAAGQRLESAVAILDRLSFRFSSYIAELTDGSLGAAGERLPVAVLQVRELADAHAAEAVTLDTLAAIVALVHQRSADLHPIIRLVETLAMAARLVAGGMGKEGAEFFAFSASIRAAGKHADGRLRQVQDGLEIMDRMLNAAREQAANFAHRHGDALKSVPARLEGNLASLVERERLAKEAAAAARERSQAVSRELAEQIFAMQLGDIVRQRLQHVCTAVDLLGEGASRTRLPEVLLAAQLDDVAGELEREGERIEAGLAGLAAAADAIGRLGTEVHAAADGRSSFIAALHGDLRQTESMFDELRDADGRTGQRMAAALKAAAELVGGLETLQWVHEDLRIMGLNATLKCGRLGVAGRPLAAVAQELREASGRFAVVAADAVEQLGRLRTIAAGLRDPGRQSRHAALAATTRDLLGALERLDALERELAAALAQLQADATQVRGLVDEAVAQFAIRHQVVAGIRQVAADLLEGQERDAPRVIDEAAQALLDRIAAGYTMAREREVHARFAPLPGRPDPQPETAEMLF